jgi:hypothetical protein
MSEQPGQEIYYPEVDPNRPKPPRPNPPLDPYPHPGTLVQKHLDAPPPG